MPARYHFFSSYHLSTSREAVWEALQDVESWPSWWRWLKQIETVKDPTSDDGVGASYRNRMSSPLGVGFTYTTTITAVERPRRIDLVSAGDLQGRGQWNLLDAPGGGTVLTYTWLAETTKWWMNLVAPVGRPAFVWNHDRLMTDFGRGFAKAAGATLGETRNEIVRPGDPGFFEMPAPVPPA